jgi:hypothetical protein
MGERRGAYRVLMGKPEGMNPLATPKCRSKNNINMDFQEVGLGGLELIYLAKDR